MYHIYTHVCTLHIHTYTHTRGIQPRVYACIGKRACIHAFTLKHTYTIRHSRGHAHARVYIRSPCTCSYMRAHVHVCHTMHTHAHIYACAHALICCNPYTYTQTRVWPCMHASWWHTYTCARVYICASCVCLYTRAHAQICKTLHTHAHICTCTHARIHRYTLPHYHTRAVIRDCNEGVHTHSRSWIRTAEVLPNFHYRLESRRLSQV